MGAATQEVASATVDRHDCVAPHDQERGGAAGGAAVDEGDGGAEVAPIHLDLHCAVRLASLPPVRCGHEQVGVPRVLQDQQVQEVNNVVVESLVEVVFPFPNHRFKR